MKYLIVLALACVLPPANAGEYPDWFVNKICEFEGFRGTTYTCAGGAQTIGYGFNITANPALYGKYRRGISKETARRVLVTITLPHVEEQVARHVDWEMSQFERLALISFTLNCGESNLISLLNNRSLHDIAFTMRQYNKAGGKTLPGLTKRRMWESCIFRLHDLDNRDRLAHND